MSIHTSIGADSAKVEDIGSNFIVGDGGCVVPLLAGQTLQGVPGIGLPVLTTRD